MLRQFRGETSVSLILQQLKREIDNNYGNCWESETRHNTDLKFQRPRVIESSDDETIDLSAESLDPLEIFADLNRKIYDNRLPQVPIRWSERLKRTAGRTIQTLDGVQRKSEIELSRRLLDSRQRLIHTLAHEMCHCAVWILDGDDRAHGSTFKKYAEQTQRLASVPVSVCHEFE